MNSNRLVEHFFRHEYGRLVAILSQRVGLKYLEDVEDAVQNALVTALETWTLKAVPDNPSAWLFKVASNNILGVLRQKNRHEDLLKKNIDASAVAPDLNLEQRLPINFQDDILNWLFICCNQAIPVESQLVFALKTLCGFNIKEISLRLFTTEANIYKRYARARNYLKKHASQLQNPSSLNYSNRLVAVNKILYLIFTEGYLSSSLKNAIRKELCEDAIRLATILVKNEIGQNPETYALLALMHLHMARMKARKDNSDDLLLLEDQDRSLWDQNEIQQGLYWLAESSQGNHFSRYHAEAGIAVEHCLAPSFAETRWHKIVECYSILEKKAPSALHRLNRAVAIAQWQGPSAGLEILNNFSPPLWLLDSYLWSAVLSDLNKRCDNHDQAQTHAQKALSLAPTPAIKKLLKKRFKIES